MLHVLVVGSPVYQKLEEIVHSCHLPWDIPRLSTSAHTFATECFHITLLQFAPKQVHFSFRSMKARCVRNLLISCLGVSESSISCSGPTSLLSIITKMLEGSKRWPRMEKRYGSSSTQKQRRDPCTVAKRKTDCTYGICPCSYLYVAGADFLIALNVSLQSMWARWWQLCCTSAQHRHPTMLQLPSTARMHLHFCEVDMSVQINRHWWNITALGLRLSRMQSKVALVEVFSVFL